MTTLRETIQLLRCECADSRSSFVPAASLDKILTTKGIRSALRTHKVQLHRENEAVNLIRQGGLKTFAILIMIYRPQLIVAFVENDQLQTTNIDSRLPYSKGDLDQILPFADSVDFFEKQWEFTAPVFRRRAGHRCLHDRTVFPFLESSGHGHGVPGDIYKVKLHRSHCIGFEGAGSQVFQADDGETSQYWVTLMCLQGHVNVVRKQLKADQEDPDGFDRECRVLSFLNCLEHPNIVELFASYTCNRVHSLIFPVAEYDLDYLLRSPQQAHFKSEADYLSALTGVASALEKLHTFVSEDLNISLIGCHHDLRPHNILVQGRELLLADFGLSSLKEVAKGSKTSWKRGDARYLAPECEDTEKDFQPGIIGRKSDIWSFGCILAEVATYMTRGARGVEDFTECRKVTLAERWTVYTFHAGRHPNEGVESWLASLEEQRGENGAGLIQVVKSTLAIEPEKRPTAQVIVQNLRHLAMKSKFLEVQSSFNTWAGRMKHPDLVIEKARCTLWARTMGLTGTPNRGDPMQDNVWSDDLYSRQYYNLEKIAQDVEPHSEAQNDLHAKTIRLRMNNDDLLHALSHASQVQINNHLEQTMVGTDDLELLQELKRTFDESSQYRSIGTLAAVKYMHQLCKSPFKGHGRRLQLHSVTWEPAKHSVHFTIGKLRFPDRPPMEALVETVKYEEHWVDEIGDEMLDRIGAVAELLRTSRSDKNMRVLSPIGYFHQPHFRSFGLAFHIPTDPGVTSDHVPEVVTLRSFIEKHQKMRPSLEQRMLLARRLASALARVHKVGWLHKGISAYSIVFLINALSEPLKHIIPSPYITGFNHSRPTNGFSNQSPYPLPVLDYRHPEYAQQHDGEVRYEPRFDYYSLGLVLLEIGLWRTLGRMTRDKESLAPRQLLAHILREHVPQLDFYVGSAYRDVVRRCLEGEAVAEPDDDDNNMKFPGDDDGAVHLAPATVEEQLASCSI
ncbi:MAG: hypothetical protein LQ344_000742 [Seirophora lacunosa]|nr:MAG: hypothetical protein LQ344_000742 [Seirophora lacunosa]